MKNKYDPHTSEKWLEAAFCRAVKRCGAVALKYSNGNETGFPDRMVLLPNGNVLWVEFKSKGKHPSPVQCVRKLQLENLGHEVYVVDSVASMDSVLDIVENRMRQ